MNRLLLIAAAVAVLVTGCGQEEQPPKQNGQAAMEESNGTMQETAPPEEAMQQEAPMAEVPEGEAATDSTDGMADETSPATDGAMDEPVNSMEQGAMETNSGAGQQEAAPAKQIAQADLNRGKEIYESSCFACHAQGIAGAPKLGDKAAWEPRIAQGMDTLVSHAINGFQGNTGVMPPKGGRMDLSDADIRAAVSYMVEQAK